MGRITRVAAILAALAAGAVMGNSGPATAQAPNSRCGANNMSCLCSFDCCGQERCSTSSCNQCVADCMQRKRPNDERSLRLSQRCQGPPDQKARRL